MEELEKLPFASVAEALEYQALQIPERPAIFYPDPDKNFLDYAYLTYKQYNNTVNYLANKISNYLPRSSSEETVTCSLLAPNGVQYLLSQVALFKLPNVIMFPISMRNSQAALEHLLKETKTALLLTTTQNLPLIQVIQQQAEFQSLKVILLDQGDFKLDELLKHKDSRCSVISNTAASTPSTYNKYETVNKIIMILHSSGTTAHPKPIFLPNHYFLLSYLSMLNSNKHIFTENDIGLNWAPLFHLLGFNPVTRCIFAGIAYALPLYVTLPPKPEELLNNIMIASNITTLTTVPILLEQLVRELTCEKNKHIGFEPLRKLKFVMSGGASCPDEICRLLVDNGVVLINIYGATETGPVLLTNFKPYDKRWKFMEIYSIRKPFLRLETPENAQSPNEKIIIHLPSDPFLAENVSNSPDGCFTIGDIILEDPPNSGRYMVLGRRNDVIVHVNGEKTNPTPMEDIIRRSPLVSQIAVVGQDRLCTAALIQLNVEQASKYDFKEIEEEIWKFIEQANEHAPSHSRLVRQLVHILPMGLTLPTTEKGNVKRQAVNNEYKSLIDDLYDKFFNEKCNEDRTNGNKDQCEKPIWKRETIKEYLEQKLKSCVTAYNNSSESIFAFGVNSLQVVELRNFICQDICEIPKTFLYEYSSVDQMTQILVENLQKEATDNQQDDPCHYKMTEDILDKYIDLIKSNQILTNNKSKAQTLERIFLITGSNGSLGSFIIRDLLQQPKSIVKRVYCLLRGSNTKERLLQSFEQRQLDTRLLVNALEGDDQRIFILPSSMNLSEEYLGQNDVVYQALQNEVTDIIHTAWKMDFNQTVKDFEFDCIRGVYHLLKLAAVGRMQFHFISSISSAGSGILSNVQEEPLPRQVGIALPQGYGQSKYVSEHLCWAAMKFWDVPVNIYRVGQISGDTQNGVWNATEMAAMMIYAGAGQLKKMPNTGQDINWIPVDVCSAVLVDLVLRSASDTIATIINDQRVYHLLNPYPTAYDDYLNLLRSAGLDFDVVSSNEFIDAILATESSNNPLFRLSSFLEQIFSSRSKLKMSKYETVKTAERCPLLKNCPSINADLIKSYLNFWKNSLVYTETS